MLGLDFETFSEISLPERGLDNYVNHPSFRPLIAAVARFNDLHNIEVQSYDFVMSPYKQKDEFRNDVFSEAIVAHNAGFEAAVLKKMIDTKHPSNIVDSAVISRALGAGSKLEAAAPQLLGVDKLEDGSRLIKKFCMPQKDGYVYIDHLEDWTDEDHDDWALFHKYCRLDAKLSLLIEYRYGHHIPAKEWRNEAITRQMNEHGWFVDVPLVKRMHERYLKNLDATLESFHDRYTGEDEEPLNFRSTPQLRKWCAERGLRVKSFDELSVSKLIQRVSKRILALNQGDPRREQLHQVWDMLETKRSLGGSSLTKLPKILDTVSSDDSRLRDQYLHVGAGQSFRTSGRGVQMQNLKRLSNPADLAGELDDMNNDELASNVRQVFRAEHPEGQLIVGDFASIESRGLAFLAGAEWKLDAFFAGKDMYKVLASSMLGVRYDNVTPDQRQTGKVGELACGYGAGPKAVRSFAEKMGVDFTEEEAAKITYDWRDANPEVTSLWRMLDDSLREVVEHGRNSSGFPLGPGNTWQLVFEKERTPESLQQQSPRSTTISMTLRDHDDRLVLQRWFQGVFMDGKDIAYHKPSELKSGKLWKDRWTKDGQSGRYKLYGGKLTGILVQSFCREIFFDTAARIEQYTSNWESLKLIGQFHDELVVEWSPSAVDQSIPSVQSVATAIKHVMEDVDDRLAGLPVVADVKFAHRYIK